MKIFFAGLALLLTVPVVADDHLDIVERALGNISADFHQQWAFTESATEKGVVFVGRYDPRLSGNKRWNLLTIDGRTPTAGEIADYQDDKEGHFDGDDNDSDIELVKLETLELIEETDDSWVFRFVPKLDDDEDKHARKFMRQVDGTLKINRNGNYLEYIDLRNKKTIRPAWGVRFSRFRTRLTFGPAGDAGPIVPLSIDVELKGRAMVFIKINESESVRYDHYEYVGSQTEP